MRKWRISALTAVRLYLRHMTEAKSDNPKILAGSLPPTIEESVDLLSELIGVWKSDPPTTLPVFDGSVLRGVGLMAHVDHAVSMTEAVLALVDKGCSFKLFPSFGSRWSARSPRLGSPLHQARVMRLCLRQLECGEP